MKKILIIEDDPIVANVYRSQLSAEGYQLKIAADGESGMEMLTEFQPHLVLLDLMLPGVSGIEVIKFARSRADFTKTPIVVISNTYLTNLIQEAWRAGANKCLAKSSCTPQDIIKIVQQLIGEGIFLSQPTTSETTSIPAKTAVSDDPEFQVELRQALIENLPATLNLLHSSVSSVIKATDDDTRLKQANELCRQIHILNSNTSIAGLTQIAHMSSAIEALLKEMCEKPKNITLSSLRTVAAAVDFLGVLFEKIDPLENDSLPPAKILVVDDEPISRRAIVYALEKAHLKSVNVDNSRQALQLLSENDFDLVFLDVDMPDMNGHELCVELRALPHHKNTPVVFVTGLSDFNNRVNSAMSGGNDFIGKPFLFIELTVKALIHVMRAHLQPAQSAPQNSQLVST